ncbi:MAG: protein-glutamate O-methyltransferase CheR [Acidibacillus sp.]|uniref:protein-glutamate O-methyltransferase n=1 Tax=Sulfoacidibacillus ferrooxidans TaxID=2005001 RepID=A0A9X2ACN3_9BACL|nr:protein-glutamate O-methyltransferase CheR [Sulfoacidibacillus ferrooxidans]MCI0184358.1 Chemotaxis protein methyltransferase [Sulfoacidibacillus ferrooxidans]MCY0894303.1 protein-glutamate O-methyltransferase CheR [Acidibacillus sp.]
MDHDRSSSLGYDWFVEQFRSTTGIDLSLYKRAQMERRLFALCTKRGYQSFEEYYFAVQDSSVLLAELLDRMTINVSEFLRNPVRWETLKKDIIPRLISSREFHAWSAACSTGQEPYTLFMILANVISIEQISILATDIDVQALSVAKRGQYAVQEITMLDKRWQDSYFIEDEHHKVVVAPFVKERITFHQHNLLADVFPTHLDLIICRNVLIYFTDDAKHMLIEKFAQALRVGGILFVGGTEQIFHPETYRLKQVIPFFYERI